MVNLAVFFSFNNMYSMLKSDPNLAIAQTSHCDQDVTYSCKRALKFNVSTIIVVENHNFLHSKPSNHEPTERILIERGNLLFIRNYILHRG